MNVGAVNPQIMSIATQPHLQDFRAELENGHGVFHKPRAIEFPVILAMEDVARADVFVRQIDGRQLTQLWTIDEHRAVILPVGWNDRMNPFVTCILGNEHFADGRRIESIEALECGLEQIKATTACDH
ncbi:hypothetical protein D3C76_1467960 [compost metagenome]